MATPDESPPAGLGEKRSRLEGGAISEEAIGSSASVLRKTGYRSGVTGLQQFFSPPEAAQLAYEVFTGARAALCVLDPTAGDGALLRPFDRRFGIEIDPDQAKAGEYTAIVGDLQRVYPLLRLAGIEFPAVVLNPPFGLDWRDGSGRSVNSTLQTYRYAVGLLQEFGQGMLIAGRDRFCREMLHEATGTYCLIEADDLFDGVELETVIAFFVKPGKLHGDEGPLRLAAARRELPALAGRVREARDARCGYVGGYADEQELAEKFRAIQLEHQRRLRSAAGPASRYDLSLNGERLACHPSAFAKVALARRGRLREAEALNGKSIHYFALNLREWRQIQAAAGDGALTIDPRLPEIVERTVRAAARDATPLYPVKPQMRLGFLEDLETLRCVESDPERAFERGERYRLFTRTKVSSEVSEKIVQLRSGEEDVRKVERSRKLLEVQVGSERFDESKESIEYLLDNFEIPDPGDIGSRFPDELGRAKTVLSDIEAEHLVARGYRFKTFQVEDLARLLVKGKGPLAWDTGLGKTLGQLTWAQACVRYWRCQDATLFVMPQDLLEQFQAEARKFFGRSVELVQTQADAKGVDRHVRRGGAGWYATHYEALSLVGRKDEPLPPVQMVAPDEQRFGKRRGDREGEPIPPRRLSSADFCPACLADHTVGWRGTACGRCGHVHKRLKVRSVGSLLAVTFRRGVICVDELTEMQGDDSLRGKAVRGMRCRHPLGGTGTPISNYVNSAFYGLWWCCGNASSRFPYDIDGKGQFEADFCVIEHTYGDDKKGEGHLRKRRKVLPEVTNLSVFWRLASTNMVRRRKEDSGEPIVARHFRPLKVPAGEQQLAHHKQVLKDFVRWFETTHPDSPLVQAGVVEQFAAGCGMLPKLDYVATLPEADPDHSWWGVPSSNWTPATLKVLELALAHVRLGDKVLIGSSLIETGPWIADRLQERGVRALHIVERRSGRSQTKNPRKRADELKAFRHGPAQVLCCGVQAVKLGHNMDQVNTVIVHGLPWTHLALKQFVDRAWRLTSERAVTVYVVYVPGMIGERKWELVKDKGEASDLALDGQLVEQPEPEPDWNEVLREIRRAGVRASGNEVPEAEVEALWARAEGPFAPIEQADVTQLPTPAAQPADPAPTVVPLRERAPLTAGEQLSLDDLLAA